MNAVGRSTNVAFVNIGQSPRGDIVPELLKFLPPDISYAEFGVLDGLTASEVAALAPQVGDKTLCTQMRDGTEVRISKRFTRDRLQLILDQLNKANFDVVVLLCTAQFDGLKSKALIIEAQAVIDGLIAAVAQNRHIGIILPAAEQAQQVEPIPGIGRTTYGHISLHPGDNQEAELREAAAAFAECDLIALHCIGFSGELRDRLAEKVKSPVLLARNVLAGALNQLL